MHILRFFAVVVVVVCPGRSSRARACPLRIPPWPTPPHSFHPPSVTPLRLFRVSCIRPSPFGPRARRSSGHGGNNASVERAVCQRIWPLWGQVGRQSAESPLAGSAGCGHITIAATISPLPLIPSSSPTFSFSLTPSTPFSLSVYLFPADSCLFR